MVCHTIHWFACSSYKPQYKLCELFAIVAAVTFGPRWNSKLLMFHCDNSCTVEVLKSSTCKNEIMDLVRHRFYIYDSHNFELSVCYVNTVNTIADSLRRLQFDRFRVVEPGTRPAYENTSFCVAVFLDTTHVVWCIN